MRAVIDAAAQALRTCPCVSVEGKTGCFRCVKSYRAQFGPGEPDRDTALQMMESILANWSNLTRTETGIDSRFAISRSKASSSSRFIQKLVERFGENCVTPQVLEGGRKGHLLRAGDVVKAHFWNIETQVQIDRRFRDMPRRRVDFLFSPVGGLNAKPIVVEMDGLKYHADTVVEDLTARLLSCARVMSACGRSAGTISIKMECRRPIPSASLGSALLKPAFWRSCWPARK